MSNMSPAAVRITRHTRERINKIEELCAEFHRDLREQRRSTVRGSKLKLEDDAIGQFRESDALASAT